MANKKTEKTEKKNYDFQIAASSISLLDDTTTTVASSYSRPESFETMCRFSWSDYDSDSVYRYLTDRMVHFGINGTRWHLKNKDLKRKEEEQAFWNLWAGRVNKGMIDILPGLDNIEAWIMKNLVLTGMAVCQWDYESLVVNKKTYQVPINITIHPSSSISLVNEKGEFGKTKAYLTDSNNNVKELTTENAFVLKLNCSPADLVVSGASVAITVSSISNAKPTLYPKPPFLTAHEDVQTRLKLRESDLDTVYKMLDQMVTVSVGDETHPPVSATVDETGTVIKKGTIEEVKDRLNDPNADRTGATRTMYLPYFIKIIRESPDTAALLNFEKYVASTTNLLMAFGIIVSPGNDTQLNLTDINTQNFEQYIEFIRKNHIARFIEGILCADIVEKNSKHLTEIPSLRFNQVNTKTNDFRTQVFNMLKLGRMSTRMALESFGVNKDHVVSDLQEEMEESKVKEQSEVKMFNENVPVAYKQESVNPAGEVKTSDRDGTNEGGRPAGKDEGKNE